MENSKYPKKLVLIAFIFKILFLATYTFSIIKILNNLKPIKFLQIILIIIAAIIFISAILTILSKFHKKRILYCIIKNVILSIVFIIVSAFFIYIMLQERFNFTIQIILLLSFNFFFGIIAYILLSTGKVKKFFNSVNPKKIILKNHFFGRFYQKSGIKIKLAALFTLVFIFLITIICFIFIVRQTKTIIDRTSEFCTYATEEVATKIHDYLLQRDLTPGMMLREFPINLKKYSKSMMINGFDSASIEINWQQQNFFKAFTLKVNNENVEISNLSNSYEKDVLSRDGSPTSIYFMLNLIVLEDQKFKAELEISRLKESLTTVTNEVIKKDINTKIERANIELKNYKKEIKELKVKIDELRYQENLFSDSKYYTFKQPIVIFGRKRNPILDEMEQKLKTELIEKFNERINQIQKIFYDDDNKLKEIWKKNPYLFRARFQTLLKQEEYLAQKVFKLRITNTAQQKFENNLKESINKIIEKRISTEGITELIPTPRFVGLVILLFDNNILYKPIWDSVYFVIMIAIIILAVAILLIIYLAIRVTKPTKNLIAGVHEIKNGNLNFNIPLMTKDEFGFLTSEFNSMVVFLKENKEMQKFISKETITMIKDKAMTSDGVKLGGEKKRMAFLFSDIRGFTSMSESKQPEEVVSIVNTYLDKQSIIIEESHGDIDKYVGDELMARFSGENMEYNALSAAVKIQKELFAMNKERELLGFPVVEVGIGINVGDVVVGSMGSHKRMDYTAIGDAVNLSARLCSAAQGGHILITREIYNKSLDLMDKFIKQEPIKVKGKAEPIEIYDSKKLN